MLILQAKEKEIENLTPNEEFVRGTVGAICQVNFDEFWQDYEKWVVFKRNGYEPIKVMVDSLTNEIEIPHTILAESGEFKIGVFGITETETLPTLYSKDIKIRYGTDTHGTTPPKYEPNEIDQLRLSKQDKLTAGDGITIDENNVISATGGGGSGGTTDYALLENKPQINSVELVGNKSLTDLGIDIPTKTSELENDSGFIDDAALENYYTKTEVDEKTVVDQTYTPDSENAQSGKAVAEAVEIKADKENFELIENITVNEEAIVSRTYADKYKKILVIAQCVDNLPKFRLTADNGVYFWEFYGYNNFSKSDIYVFGEIVIPNVFQNVYTICGSGGGNGVLLPPIVDRYRNSTSYFDGFKTDDACKVGTTIKVYGVKL